MSESVRPLPSEFPDPRPGSLDAPAEKAVVAATAAKRAHRPRRWRSRCRRDRGEEAAEPGRQPRSKTPGHQEGCPAKARPAVDARLRAARRRPRAAPGRERRRKTATPAGAAKIAVDDGAPPPPPVGERRRDPSRAGRAARGRGGRVVHPLRRRGGRAGPAGRHRRRHRRPGQGLPQADRQGRAAQRRAGGRARQADRGRPVRRGEARTPARSSTPKLQDASSSGSPRTAAGRRTTCSRPTCAWSSRWPSATPAAACCSWT